MVRHTGPEEGRRRRAFVKKLPFRAQGGPCPNLARSSRLTVPVMPALPTTLREAPLPPAPALLEPAAGEGADGVTQLRTVSAALDRSPAVYEHVGKLQRAPRVPSPPPLRPLRAEPPPASPEVWGLAKAAVGEEQARLEGIRHLLTSQVERVNDRLAHLNRLQERLAHVQAELQELNEASHQVESESNALLAEMGEALAGLTEAAAPSGPPDDPPDASAFTPEP